MIKNLKVEGLNGKLDLDIEFNSDLNLFTGKNGAGKTTVLKLIWFLNGGYISHLISEINFQNIKLETEKAKIEISKKPIEKKRERASHLIYDMKVNEQSFSINEVELRQLDFRRPRYYEYLSNFRDASIPTIFFPTFRRIEGGFSMERNRYNEPMPVRTSVREALNELSERMSFPLHKFIASISTEDLIQLLTSEFAKTTEEFNRLQKKQSDIIIEKIKKRKGNDDTEILTSVQKDIEFTESNRQEFYKPFTVLSELIIKIFQHKGISLNTLTIGDISNAIASDKLSAGEKQMLSFLCYNTFTKSSAIFIDEPELSLHPDWQRTLVPVLLEQGNDNQFFMATHSPFIYSKYPDKEIIIHEDKGN